MKKIFTISLLLLITLSSCGTDNSANNTEKTSSTWETQSSVESNYLYVDVRTDEEWAEWHIDWAIHLKQGFTNLVNAWWMKDIKDVTIVK